MKNIVGCAAMIAALSFSPMLAAQNRGWQDQGRRDQITRIEPGTVIPVRLNQTINANRPNNQIYTGTVDQDVLGGNGRLAIPRGSQVNLRVRTTPRGDLVLDVDSVFVRGREFGMPTSPQRMGGPNNNAVGNIIGSITGQQVQGRQVRVHRGTVLNFRINRPLEMRASRYGG